MYIDYRALLTIFFQRQLFTIIFLSYIVHCCLWVLISIFLHSSFVSCFCICYIVCIVWALLFVAPLYTFVYFINHLPCTVYALIMYISPCIVRPTLLHSWSGLLWGVVSYWGAFSTENTTQSGRKECYRVIRKICLTTGNRTIQTDMPHVWNIQHFNFDLFTLSQLELIKTSQAKVSSN